LDYYTGSVYPLIVAVHHALLADGKLVEVFSTIAACHQAREVLAHKIYQEYRKDSSTPIPALTLVSHWDGHEAPVLIPRTVWARIIADEFGELEEVQSELPT